MNERRAILRFEVPLGILGAGLVGLAALFAVAGIPNWIPPALTVRFGIPSPLTGMTRSFVATASGDIAAAFLWHPLGPPAFAACVATPMVALASWVRARRFATLSRWLSSRKLWVALAFLTVLVWSRQIVAL